MPYNYNLQMECMNKFRDYPKFISDLETAIADERAAVVMYSELYRIAPTEFARYAYKTALEDEKVHDRRLTRLYIHLTGREPEIQVKEEKFQHFYDGLRMSFIGEVKAFEFYKNMYLATNCDPIRDLLYSIQHDEIEHATLFNWVFTEIK